MYLDFPNHDSVYANTNLSQQTKTLRYGLNVSQGQAFTSTGANTFNNNVYVETQPHALLGSKMFNYVIEHQLRRLAPDRAMTRFPRPTMTLRSR